MRVPFFLLYHCTFCDFLACISYVLCVFLIRRDIEQPNLAVPGHVYHVWYVSWDICIFYNMLHVYFMCHALRFPGCFTYAECIRPVSAALPLPTHSVFLCLR